MRLTRRSLLTGIAALLLAPSDLFAPAERLWALGGLTTWRPGALRLRRGSRIWIVGRPLVGRHYAYMSQVGGPPAMVTTTGWRVDPGPEVLTLSESAHISSTPTEEWLIAADDAGNPGATLAKFDAQGRVCLPQEV